VPYLKRETHTLKGNDLKIEIWESEGLWEWAILDEYGDELTSSPWGFDTREEARVDARSAYTDFEPLTYNNDEGE